MGRRPWQGEAHQFVAPEPAACSRFRVDVGYAGLTRRTSHPQATPGAPGQSGKQEQSHRPHHREPQYLPPPPPLAKPGSAGFTRPAGLGCMPPANVPSPDWEQVMGRASRHGGQQSGTAYGCGYHADATRRGTGRSFACPAPGCAILACRQQALLGCEAAATETALRHDAPGWLTGSWSQTSIRLAIFGGMSWWAADDPAS